MAESQRIRVGQLYNGLSNQAPWRQFPGQVKDILNMSLDVSIGARTRSGTRLVGELGATEYLVSVPGGEVTRLPVGKPETTPITGHEAWISGRDEILMSVRASDDYTPDKGNLIAVTASGEVRRVGVPGAQINHVGTTPDGRFFTVDDWRDASELIIGSTKSGKSVVVCEARTSMGRSQDTHGHPYLSPDAKWLVFNSDRSGQPQIHVASVPDAITTGVLSED